jgi:hypothetical protein
MCSLLLLVATTGFAQDLSGIMTQLSAARAIPADGDRLKAYDALVDSLAHSSNASSDENLTAWGYSTQEDKANNKTYHFFFAKDANDPQQMIFIQYAISKIPSLSSVAVFFPNPWGSSHTEKTNSVAFFSDPSDPVKLEAYAFSFDNKNLVAPSAKKFLAYLTTKAQVSMLVKYPWGDDGKNDKTYSFDVYGLESCFKANSVDYQLFLKTLK